MAVNTKDPRATIATAAPLVDRQRVLLDTNVWRYLVDHDGIEELHRRAGRHGVEVQVAPAVFYEMLRFEDTGLRAKLVKAATRKRWSRLMTEVYLATNDLAAVIEKHRPSWIRRPGNPERLRAMRNDWINPDGFWDRARRNPAREASYLSAVEGLTFQRAALDIDSAQKQAIKDPVYKKMTVDDVLASADRPVPGWDGQQVEAWRWYAQDTWGNGILGNAQRAYVDWTDPWLDRDAIRRDPASWTRLWLHEVDTSECPREWVRWAMGWVQLTGSVNSGSPGDNQLAAHLLDTDVIVTSDKRFAKQTTAIRERAPGPLASCVLLPGGPDALPALWAALDDLKLDAT